MPRTLFRLRANRSYHSIELKRFLGDGNDGDARKILGILTSRNEHKNLDSN